MSQRKSTSCATSATIKPGCPSLKESDQRTCLVLGEPISAPTIQTNAKAFCPAEFINTLIEKIHPWHSVCIKAVTPWSVQFTLGSHRANFYASSESEGRVRVLTTWGSGVSMESLSQYADQMNGFAEHINGILEGKIRDDEGKLVEVLLHDKPQADGSIGVALSDGWPPYKDSLISQDLEKAKRKALNCGCPPILERRDKDGDIQYWDLEGGVLYDSRFNPVDPSLYEYVLYGTGNKHFDGRSCEVIDHPNPGGKCQVRVGESVTWVDSSMLFKDGQIQVIKERLATDHSPSSRNKVDHSVGANKLVPPFGYRLLHKSAKVEPRREEDLYWSTMLAEWRILESSQVEYANRDNWAACRKVEPATKQSLTTEPPDGWRWLELGEVIRKGDRCLTNNGGSIDCLTSVGEKFNHEAHYPTIRRNKFGVGEKVIDFCGQVWEVEYISDTGTRYRLKHKEVRDEGYGNSLAPYIEETT